MKKKFFITKEYLEEVVGCKNVVTGDSPLCTLNGRAVFAKTITWANEEELLNDDMFNDTKAMNGLVFIYDMDLKKFLKQFNEVDIPNDNEKWEFVESPKEADEIMGRFYLQQTIE